MTKYIFKVVLGLAIVLVFPFFASAQDQDDLKNSTPEQRARYQTDWMKTELSLDTTLVPAVYDINLKYAKKNQSLMNSGGSRMQKFKEMKSNSEDKDSELKKIFTKDQYKLYQQKKEEMKQKMKQKIQERRNKS